MSQMEAFNIAHLKNSLSVENWVSRAGLIMKFGLTVIFSLVADFMVILIELLGESGSPLRVYRLSMALSDIVLGVLCFLFTFTKLIINRWVFMGDLASTLTLAVLAFKW